MPFCVCVIVCVRARVCLCVKRCKWKQKLETSIAFVGFISNPSGKNRQIYAPHHDKSRCSTRLPPLTRNGANSPPASDPNRGPAQRHSGRAEATAADHLHGSTRSVEALPRNLPHISCLSVKGNSTLSCGFLSLFLTGRDGNPAKYADESGDSARRN